MTLPDSLSQSARQAPMPSSPTERAALEAARERAIRLLTDRFADDTLTVDEFEARLDRMYQAGTPPQPPRQAPMPPPPTERAALEAARERAIRLLTDRFADDTLTVDEFEARLDRMYQAGTPGDLDALTSDLVGTTGVVPAAVGF